jgi:hypothetical protein
MDVWKIIIVIVFSVLSGVMGRMGGSGRFPRQVRVIGVPFIQTLLFFLFGVHAWWSLLISFGLTIAAISTYWDFLYKFDEFYTHGFFIGLSAFTIALVTGHWWLFAIRTIMLTVFIGVWSALISNTVWEESGRYTSIPLTAWMVC